MGILIALLISILLASTANSVTRLDNQEARITAVEKAIAVSETNANYIKAAVDEIKGFIKEHLRENK